jgi:hypothetical protein
MTDNGQKPPGKGRPRDCDHLLLQAFMMGFTVENAARHAGCGEKTARRRLRNPRFLAKLGAERKHLLERTADRLAQYAVAAADVLHGLLSSANEPVRLGAARTLLEAAAHARVVQELSDRVAALEASAPASLKRLVG